jgi:uncharacterized YccA/Bax inhibitor family protein
LRVRALPGEDAASEPQEAKPVSTQVLNDQTFSATRTRELAPEAGRPMTYGAVIVRALFLLILTAIAATVGWNVAGDVGPRSGLWFFLGYLLLIALTFAAAANPRLAAVAGIVYALLMGVWMGSISRIYDAYYDGIVLQAILASLARSSRASCCTPFGSCASRAASFGSS